MRHFCLGTCAYQKYHRFRFLDYLGFMEPLQLIQAIASDPAEVVAYLFAVNQKLIYVKPPVFDSYARNYVDFIDFRFETCPYKRLICCV